MYVFREPTRTFDVIPGRSLVYWRAAHHTTVIHANEKIQRLMKERKKPWPTRRPTPATGNRDARSARTPADSHSAIVRATTMFDRHEHLVDGVGDATVDIALS